MRELEDAVEPAWLDVSRETLDALKSFAGMVLQWTTRINLISPGTQGQIWQRHILDSAQLYSLAPNGGIWTDLGSGGGFPGIVVAILAKGRGAGTKFHLIESDQRKSAFLRKAAMELDLPVQVHAVRAENVPPLASDVVSARALAPLDALLPFVARHIGPGGTALLPKGARAEEELAAAEAQWSFDLDRHASQTDPAAQVLVIRNLRHV